ncbi:MAG: hydrogenase formation protein HypD [Thermoprotei archaeon]|nr:MAG: hydrogenase formation protein HypD [Thermoprotei archaeon]
MLREYVMERNADAYRELISKVTKVYSGALVAKIRKLARGVGRAVKIMDFCGTHEWTITHYGIRTLVPDGVELIAGPGCPVCITPAYYVDQLIKLSLDGVEVLTYGDAVRLPASVGLKPRSLLEAKAIGGKVHVVYSFMDAVKYAKSRTGDMVFFAIGFETTMPSVASVIIKGKVPKNLTILTAYRYTPPIVRYLFTKVKGVHLDGVIAPGHVSAVIGASSWEFIPKDYGVPTVVAGFEAIDVLIAIEKILEMIAKSKAELVNEYSRVVKWEGNKLAKKAISEVFDVHDAYWRGIGFVERSGGFLRDRFKEYDAVRQYGLRDPPEDLSKEIIPGCKCHEVVLGLSKPTDCPLFMKVCRPSSPYGPCMVSIEGTCRIWAEHPEVLMLKEIKSTSNTLKF